MTFLYPTLLWLLLPLAILLWKSVYKVQQATHVFILMLLLISLARPVQEKALQEAHIQAKDIIITLDVSYSMRATDLPPTRYDYAKQTINALLAKNAGDNIMLIAFTTNPLLLSPPTTDHALITIALESLNPEFILTKGTSLKTLFKKLSMMHLGQKSLILITDGGEESDATALSTSLQETQLSLTTLALGSTKGVTVTKKDGTLLKDTQGNLVVTRINPMLKTLTTLVGGTYLTASSTPEDTAKALDNALRSDAQKKQNIQKMQRHYRELYTFSLGLALLLFLFVHTRAVKYLLLLFTLLGVQAQASFIDEYHLHHAYDAYRQQQFQEAQTHLKQIHVPSLQSQMALADTYYKLRTYKQAIGLYKTIQSRSVNTKQHLYYNIANAYSMLEAYDKAKIYYTKVLQLGASEDARFNLAQIALLQTKKDASLGIAHPKSQSANASTSASQDEDEKKSQKDEKSGSGSGGGGNKSSKESEKKQQLTAAVPSKKQPLGSKVYELINKGYIRETQPW